MASEPALRAAKRALARLAIDTAGALTTALGVVVAPVGATSCAPSAVAVGTASGH